MKKSNANKEKKPSNKKIENSGKKSLYFLLIIIIIISVGLNIYFTLLKPMPELDVVAGVIKVVDSNSFFLSCINIGPLQENLDFSLTSSDPRMDMNKCYTNLDNLTYSGCFLEHKSKFQLILHCPRFPIKAIVYIKCEMNTDDVNIMFAADSNIMTMQKNYVNCISEKCSENVSQTFFDYHKIFKNILPQIPIS